MYYTTDIGKIVCACLALKPHELISFHRISRIVGYKVNGGSVVYQKAKTILRREHGIMLSSVRGYGAKYVVQDEALEDSIDKYDHDLTRTQKRKYEDIDCIDIAGLNPRSTRILHRYDEIVNRVSEAVLKPTSVSYSYV